MVSKSTSPEAKQGKKERMGGREVERESRARVDQEEVVRNADTRSGHATAGKGSLRLALAIAIMWDY